MKLFLGDSLGKHFTKRLLEESACTFYFLIRSSRKADAIRARYGDKYLRRIRFVFGDITKPDLGIRLDVYEDIIYNITEFWHIAANTDLNGKRDTLKQMNVEGTRNVIGFASKMKRLESFYHVSTAYSCGRKSKSIIYENDFESENSDFKNVYEESKHKAESMVRGSSLPWVILKPSIVVGDSKTGIVESHKMMYGIMRSYHAVKKMMDKARNNSGNGSDPIYKSIEMEASAHTQKNLICVDDVSRLMILIRNKKPKKGSVFHLSNSVPANVRDIHESICATLNTPFIRLVSEITNRELSTEEKLLRRSGKAYKPYLFEDDPIFDISQTKALIGSEYTCKRLDRELLDFLFKNYYERELVKKEIFSKVKCLSFDERRQALQKYMSNSISYFTTGDTYKVYFVPDIEGYLPYVQSDNTAIIIGDPVTAERNYGFLLDGFIAETKRCHISITALQISKKFAEYFESRGYFVNCIGIETFVKISDFNLSGNRMKKLRQNISAAVRHGVHVIEKAISAIEVDEVNGVSKDWMKKKENKQELSLIIRPLDSSKENDVRRFYAFHDMKIVGYIYFNPIYNNGNIVGYLADIERYKTYPPGIHDCILNKAIQTFQEEKNVEYISLGLSPLEDIDRHERNTYSPITSEIIKSVREEERPVYSFKNVSRHKKLYRGNEQPLYYASSRSEVKVEIVNLFHEIGMLTPQTLLQTSDELFLQLVP